MGFPPWKWEIMRIFIVMSSCKEMHIRLLGLSWFRSYYHGKLQVTVTVTQGVRGAQNPDLLIADLNALSLSAVCLECLPVTGMLEL